jgi:dissimilatory sulfite reductase (desulfoviridin) alpha/beta subunit
MSTVTIASENLPEKTKTVKISESLLKDHMRSAATRDLNPWFQGYQGEIVSKLEVLHPDIGRLTSREIAFQNDGWLSADSLFLLAELSENRGAGLIEFSGPDKTAKLIALEPQTQTLPWASLKRAGFTKPETQSIPGCCPFWGPCLGRKIYLSEAINELAKKIEPQIHAQFRVELAGCPLDCRLAAAKADLAIILDDDTSNFVIWLGGRHRPFRKKILPKPWLKHEVSEIKELLERVSKVHDFWSSLAMGEETLPELADRLGFSQLEKLITQGHKSTKKP